MLKVETKNALEFDRKQHGCDKQIMGFKDKTYDVSEHKTY